MSSLMAGAGDPREITYIPTDGSSFKHLTHAPGNAFLVPHEGLPSGFALPSMGTVGDADG